MRQNEGGEANATLGKVNITSGITWDEKQSALRYSILEIII